MARPPVLPAEEKVRVVLSILAGEITVAEGLVDARAYFIMVGTEQPATFTYKSLETRFFAYPASVRSGC